MTATKNRLEPKTKPVKKNYSIVVAGPTAVGKTAVAIVLARWLNTAIVSADSRQCYREMNIGVATPSPEELAAATHYFIGSHSIFDKLNAAEYAKLATAYLDEIFKSNVTSIVVGGTGLYIKALLEGLDELPEIPASVRESITAQYEENGLPWLQTAVEQEDPLFYSSADQQNPQRLMRALEVMRVTGQSIRTYQKGRQVRRPFTAVKIGLELPRNELYTRINDRVDQMMQAGLLNEVKELHQLLTQRGLKPNDLPALQTVGYAELFAFLDGAIGLPAAVEKIKQHTRNYAKRQMTWFKRDANMRWFHPGSVDDIKAYITEQIS